MCRTQHGRWPQEPSTDHYLITSDRIENDKTYATLGKVIQMNQLDTIMIY